MQDWVMLVATIFVGTIILIGLIVMIARLYRQVEQGKALIVNGLGKEPTVTFTGTMVYPIINKAELMDISVKSVEIDRRGKEGLICKDNIRADINVNFFVRVNKTREDVLKVAQSIGCARASNPQTLREIFTAKFSEALKTVGKHFNFEDLYKMREEFKDQIIKVIGKDLNGFVLDDAAIDFLEQTPMASLDPNNIMDAEGIKKITDLTVQQNVKTNELRQRERMEVGSQNLTADEAIFRFEQKRAEAEAKKNKEIAIVQSREQNEAARVASEEHKKTELVRQKNEEESLVAAEVKARGVAVAQKNREREVAVEAERVEKARQIEVVAREREVSLSAIAKEKDLELQKKEIADVVRARIAVDKTVAQEEEHIKDLRSTAQANRDKETMRIVAEAEAQGALVKNVKAAEASEEVAKHKARERLLTAESELEAAEKVAKAKARVAEGVAAEHAAKGLADVRVKEADAIAIEKLGLAQARVSLEKMQAEAAGEEKQGLAKVRVREAEADAIQKQGAAEASAAKDRMLAEATGTREKLAAEAAGIAEKAQSMRALDEASRGHEEFRLRLDKEKTVDLAHVKARVEVAQQQAKILSEAFGHAKINIVGGDGQFFDRFVKAVAVGQSVDGVVDQSETIRHAFREYLEGDKSLVADLKDVLSRSALTTGDVKNLTLSTLLAKLASRVDAPARSKLEGLAARAQELGIDQLTTD